MRGRTILVIIAGCVLLTAAVIIFCLWDTEPSYNGRTLAQWVKASSQASGERETHIAIISIATNFAPVLVRWVFADTTPRFDLLNQLPFNARQHPFLRPFLFRDKEMLRAACAMRAFEIAGTNAVSAITALEPMVTGHNPQAVQVLALHVLSLIGTPAVPSIRHATLSSDSFVRFAAIGALRRIGTNATEAIPDLVRALSDQHFLVRQNATNALETLFPQILTNPPPR